MDLYTLNGVSKISDISPAESLKGTLLDISPQKETTGTMFDAFLNTAIDNIKTTNSYLSDAENEEIKFALGETENTHDLMIALQKASTALQYTVAIRDKLMDAYKEIMQMQI
ncbi:MAG: flagellar hook-basal body complex protein FliE [Butyrivibrio sp.]|nr:flagellar hook-basal body complex protein FliE [Acetatifactor muris]MCM1558115.1 flagellar hook-basal body complex protein FliE [Butyrivibrio sp.]